MDEDQQQQLAPRPQNPHRGTVAWIADQLDRLAWLYENGVTTAPPARVIRDFTRELRDPWPVTESNDSRPVGYCAACEIEIGGPCKDCAMRPEHGLQDRAFWREVTPARREAMPDPEDRLGPNSDPVRTATREERLRAAMRDRPGGTEA